MLSLRGYWGYSNYTLIVLNVVSQLCEGGWDVFIWQIQRNFVGCNYIRRA